MYLLYKITIETDDDNIFRLNPDSDALSRGALPFAVKATPEQVRRFLKRCQVGDSESKPRSKRNVSFNSIIDNLCSCNSSVVFCFAHKYPKTLEQLRTLLL